MYSIFDMFPDGSADLLETPEQVVGDTDYAPSWSERLVDHFGGDSFPALDPRDLPDSHLGPSSLPVAPDHSISNENLTDNLILPSVLPLINIPDLWDDVNQRIDEVIKDITSFVVQPLVPEQSNLVYPEQFSADGLFDTKNGLVVEGNVANDISYIDQQHHSSCSLMAQEQFVERYIGRAIPEDYLEWQAEQWGVYSPVAGTNFCGQTMVLDHFNIPYSRDTNADLHDLNMSLDDNMDAIVGVDAREFYQDATIPPGSGHAVAVVGKGIDPLTHETEGFYITDSNNPGTVRFMKSDEFENAWVTHDMITIPNPKVA